MEEALAEIQARSTLTAGDIEGRYRILEKIGVGGMGTVYRAEHVVLHKQLAIKVLRTELLNDSSAMARFEQESRACAALSHPNLVAVYDCGVTEQGQPYLVMEFLSGKSLLEIVKEQGALPLSKFFAVFIEATEALAYAHEHGVIHRDLKPSNILVSSDPRGGEITKIVDFGVAKIEDMGGEFQMLTRTGEVFGSPAYMSPEQCHGSYVDQRSDIYALGCVMYEALSGKQAFKGANIMTIMNKQLESLPPPMERANIPDELQDLVKTCLEKDPNRRFQSMQELRKQLERACENSTYSKSIKFGSFRMPAAALPLLVSLAVLVSILAYPAMLPGGSLQGLARTFNSTSSSRLMLAAYTGRRHMNEYSTELFKSILEESDARNTNVVDRCAIAVFFFDHLYHQESYREILELFGSTVSEFLDSIEQSVKANPQSASGAAWSAPLICYYAGGAQESEKNYSDAQRKYRRGLHLANLLDSPKWVKAQLNEELGELLLVQSNPQPQNAIAPLKEARRLLLSERATIIAGKQGALTDSTNLLFDAYEKSGKPGDAAELMKSWVTYQQSQPKINVRLVLDGMEQIIRLSRKTKNQPQLEYWLKERDKVALVAQVEGDEEGKRAPYTVQLIRAQIAKADRFEIKEIFERFNNALSMAERKHAPDLDRIAIANAALDVCTDYWLATEAEHWFDRIEPSLQRIHSHLTKAKPGEFVDAGQSALVLHNLASVELLKNNLTKAREFIEMAKPYTLGQPDGEWTAGRIDVMEAKILVAQNQDFDEAEQAAVRGINRLSVHGDKKNYRVADGYWALGQVLAKKKQYQAAKTAVNRAISIVKNNPGNEWRTASEYQPELDKITAAERK
jgi:serine/threonine protein kinase